MTADEDDSSEYIAYLESGFHDVDFPGGFCKKCGMLCKINWARFPGECSGAAILHNLVRKVKEWKE